jgi:hypothetical protein
MKRYWLVVTAGLLISTLGGGCQPSRPLKPTEIAVPTTISTSTPIPSPRPLSTLSTTPMLRLTGTPTSSPQWVADFAQPILDIIATRPPDVAEDFSDSYHIREWYGSKSAPVASSSIEFRDGELFVTNSSFGRNNLAYGDFVLEIDGRFVQGTGFWEVSFRDNQHTSALVLISHNGDVSLSVGQTTGFTTSTDNPLIHLLIIVHDTRIAIYVDDEMGYFEYPAIPTYGTIHFRVYPHPTEWKSVLTIAFDSLKIWDLSGVPMP